MSLDFLERFRGNAQEMSSQFPERIDDDIASKRINDTVDIDGLMEKIKRDLLKQRLVLESLARLVIELEKDLPQYDTILSDDASGRIPSLVLKGVIDKIRAKDGRPPIKINFLAAGRHENSKDRKKGEKSIEQFVAERKKTFKKVLLITEYISAGESIGRLIKILDKHDVNLDIAVVSVDPESEFKYLPDNLKSRLHYGTHSDAGLGLHYKPSSSGIIKEIYKTSPSDITSPHPVRNPDAKQADINQTREDVRAISEELSKLIT